MNFIEEYKAWLDRAITEAKEDFEQTENQRGYVAGLESARRKLVQLEVVSKYTGDSAEYAKYPSGYDGDD